MLVLATACACYRRGCSPIYINSNQIRMTLRKSGKYRFLKRLNPVIDLNALLEPAGWFLLWAVLDFCFMILLN